MPPLHAQVDHRLAAQGGQAHAGAHAVVAHVVAAHVLVVVVVEHAQAVGSALEIAAAVVGHILQAGCHFPAVIKLEGARLEALERGVFGLGPVLIGEVDFAQELVAVPVAHAHAIGVGQLVLASELGVAHSVELAVASHVVVGAPRVPVQRLAGRVGEAHDHAVVAVELKAVLCTQVHVPVAHFHHTVVETGRGAVDVGVVVDCAKHIGEVGAQAQVLHRLPAGAQVKLAYRALAYARLAAAVQVVAEAVAHARKGHHAEGATQVLGYPEAAGDVVEAAPEAVAALAVFFRPHVGEVDAHVPQEGERVGVGIACGVHGVHLPAVLTGIAHAAHLALSACGVLAQYAVAQARVGRDRGLRSCVPAACKGQQGDDEVSICSHIVAKLINSAQ